MSKADEPAFPHMGTYGIDGVKGPNYGLTKREYFAAMAMMGMLAAVEREHGDGITEEQTYKIAAGRSAWYADVLAAALERKPE